MVRVLIFLLFLAVLPVSMAHALVPPGFDPLSISITPQYPRPYDTVTVTIGSTLFNIAASDVRILVNGTIVEEGVGVTRTAVPVGRPGEATRITVHVDSEGQTYTKELTVRPAEVALITEATTSAHPFYRGGLLPVSEGPIRFTAIPLFESAPGVRLSPDTLLYTWRVGDRTLQNESGIGRSVLLATAPVQYRDTAVIVTVTSRDGSLVAQAGVAVTPSDPLVRIYRNDPLMGIRYEEALSGTIELQGDEETLHVIPYYFDGFPALSWTINSVEQGTDNDITLRSSGGAGSATVGVSARNAGAFQSAGQTLTVRFGANQSTNFFGF